MRRSKRRWGWLTLAAMTAATAFAADDNRILIGQTAALTGGTSEHGRAVVAGARAFLDGVNAAGGIGGRRIELITMDDGGDAARAAENTRRLIELDRVVAMFGGIEGGPCVASLKEATAHSVPLVACMAGSPELREPFNRLSFPVRAPHVLEFEKLLEVAATYGLRKVAFLHADSVTGHRHLANVRRLAERRQIEIVPIPVSADAKPDALADAVIAARPDAMFNHGSYAIYAATIRSAKAKGATTLFMAVNSGAAQMAKLLGGDATGLIFTQVVPFPWSVAVPLVKEYQQTIARVVPAGTPSFSSLEGYASAKLLVAGLRAAGPKDLSSERLQRAMESLGTVDLGGMVVQYGATSHAGSSYVETVIVASDGRFAR